MPKAAERIAAASSSAGSGGSGVVGRGKGQDQLPPILPDKPPSFPLPGKAISAVTVRQDGSAAAMTAHNRKRVKSFMERVES